MTRELIDNSGKRLGLIILLGQEIMYVHKDINLEYIISPGELVMLNLQEKKLRYLFHSVNMQYDLIIKITHILDCFSKIILTINKPIRRPFLPFINLLYSL